MAERGRGQNSLDVFYRSRENIKGRAMKKPDDKSAFTTPQGRKRSKVYTSLSIALVILMIPIVVVFIAFVSATRGCGFSDYGEVEFCEEMRKIYPDFTIKAYSSGTSPVIFFQVNAGNDVVLDAMTALDIFEKTARFIASQETADRIEEQGEQCDGNYRGYGSIRLSIQGKGEEPFNKSVCGYIARGVSYADKGTDPSMRYFPFWTNIANTNESATTKKAFGVTEFRARFNEGGVVVYEFNGGEYIDKVEFIAALES